MKPWVWWVGGAVVVWWVLRTPSGSAAPIAPRRVTPTAHPPTTVSGARTTIGTGAGSVVTGAPIAFYVPPAPAGALFAAYVTPDVPAPVPPAPVPPDDGTSSGTTDAVLASLADWMPVLPPTTDPTTDTPAPDTSDTPAPDTPAPTLPPSTDGVLPIFDPIFDSGPPPQV